jgi:hypothetical protein
MDKPVVMGEPKALSESDITFHDYEFVCDSEEFARCIRWAKSMYVGVRWFACGDERAIGATVKD